MMGTLMVMAVLAWRRFPSPHVPRVSTALRPSQRRQPWEAASRRAGRQAGSKLRRVQGCAVQCGVRLAMQKPVR